MAVLLVHSEMPVGVKTCRARITQSDFQKLKRADLGRLDSGLVALAARLSGGAGRNSVGTRTYHLSEEAQALLSDAGYDSVIQHFPDASVKHATEYLVK